MNYLFIIFSYILGTINPCFIIGKLKGVDVRTLGSKNCGASNAAVLFGWGYGIFVTIFDMFKGGICVLLAKKLFPLETALPMIAGCAAVFGHIFPFYLGFKAGKGFATLNGMLLFINWKIALIIMLCGVVLTLVTGYIVVATFTMTTAYVIYYYVTNYPLIGVLALTIVWAVILFKHKENIIRIIKGEEITLYTMKKHRV